MTRESEEARRIQLQGGFGNPGTLPLPVIKKPLAQIADLVSKLTWVEMDLLSAILADMADWGNDSNYRELLPQHLIEASKTAAAQDAKN